MSNTMNKTVTEIETLRAELAAARQRINGFQAELAEYEEAAKDGRSDSVSRYKWAISYEDGLAQKCEVLVKRLAEVLAPIRAKIARLDRLAGNNPSREEAALAAARAAQMRVIYGLVRAKSASVTASPIAFLGA